MEVERGGGEEDSIVCFKVVSCLWLLANYEKMLQSVLELGDLPHPADADHCSLSSLHFHFSEGKIRKSVKADEPLR